MTLGHPHQQFDDDDDDHSEGSISQGKQNKRFFLPSILSLLQKRQI